MSDANRIQVSYRRTLAGGQPIISELDHDILRVTSDGLKQDTDTTRSQEIRSDRQTADVLRTNASVSGEIGFELVYGVMDPFFEQAFYSDPWNGAIVTNTVPGATDISATAPNIFTGVTVNEFTPFAAGDIVEVTGFANVANNAHFEVVSVTTVSVADDTLTLNTGTIVTEAAGAAVTFTRRDPLADVVGTNLAADSGANTITASSGTPFTDVIDGMYVIISGFATSQNNDFARIVSHTDTVLTLAEIVLITEAEGASVTLEFSSFITNGVTETIAIIERQYVDKTAEFALFQGLRIDTMSLNVTNNAIVTGAFGFMGLTEEANSVSEISGDFGAAPTNTPQNGVDNVTKIILGTGITATTLCLQDFAFNLANNLRQHLCIGTLGPVDFGTGTSESSGNFSAFYEDKTEYELYLAFTSTELKIIFQDAQGNRYLLDLPLIKLADGDRTVPGLNQDVVAAFDYEAFRDPTLGFTVRLHRWAA